MTLWNSTLFGTLVVLSSPVWSQTVARVSIGQGGSQCTESASEVSMSSDGHFVAFYTDSVLVFGDRNDAGDVYLRDRLLEETTLVSVNAFGRPGNGDSLWPSISGDGRFISFYSVATDLVPGDTNGMMDVFVRDLVTHTTERVSVDSAGVEGNGGSYNSSISGDGRFVMFGSEASNLVTGDSNTFSDLFVHDRLTSATTRVNVSSSGAQATRGSNSGSISQDGRHVVFDSISPNLVPGDTNNRLDIFERDLVTGTTVRVHVASNGAQANAGAYPYPAISADGRFTVFGSYASNLAAGGTSAAVNLFVHDRVTGTTRMVSLSSGGASGTDITVTGTISNDGRYVAFRSHAANLVEEDTNARPDVFIRDLVSETTRRVNAFGGGNPDGSSGGAAISPDGQHIAFYSTASNLVPGDTNGVADAFVVDRAKILRR